MGVFIYANIHADHIDLYCGPHMDDEKRAKYPSNDEIKEYFEYPEAGIDDGYREVRSGDRITNIHYHFQYISELGLYDDLFNLV